MAEQEWQRHIQQCVDLWRRRKLFHLQASAFNTSARRFNERALRRRDTQVRALNRLAKYLTPADQPVQEAIALLRRQVLGQFNAQQINHAAPRAGRPRRGLTLDLAHICWYHRVTVVQAATYVVTDITWTAAEQRELFGTATQATTLIPPLANAIQQQLPAPLTPRLALK